ncbi:hypothetical protein AGMMS49938_10310 [Fibrobacterales bacterium]|nr:hypothetical protein AGMMS49938_10310 [Fibrobacterales bacterium]
MLKNSKTKGAGVKSAKAVAKTTEETMKPSFWSGWWGEGPISVYLYDKRKKLDLMKDEIYEAKSFIADAEHSLNESEALRTVYTEGEFIRSVLFVDVGKEKGLDELDHLRMAGFRIAKWAESHAVDKILIPTLKEDSERKRTAFSQGLHHADYSFDKYKSEKKKKKELTYFFIDEFIFDDDYQSSLFDGIRLAKDLINEPGGSLTPKDVCAMAGSIAKQYKLSIKIRRTAELKRDNYNGILTVGRGSKNEPAMVTLTYKPAVKSANVKGGAGKVPKLALVGKGITFDTGGICLKPQDKMWEMKSDMSGAATMLAAIQVIAALKLPIEVTTILCLAENRPGENAVLPGDIFKAKNGKTVMVENTDAEGRLVLIDGLAEAADLGATHIIDIATLTGAIQRALGTSIAGLFSNSDELAERIKTAGAAEGEKWWRMPLDEEYSEGLNDKVADIRNITDGGPGAITAALFLQEFVKKDIEWAHLDIAGTAFTTKGYKYTENGATAFGLKTIVETAREYSQNGKK